MTGVQISSCQREDLFHRVRIPVSLKLVAVSKHKRTSLFITLNCTFKQSVDSILDYIVFKNVRRMLIS